MGYDLEERTLLFAIAVRDFCRKLKCDVINKVYIVQLIRSSSSIALITSKQMKLREG